MLREPFHILTGWLYYDWTDKNNILTNQYWAGTRLNRIREDILYKNENISFIYCIGTLLYECWSSDPSLPFPPTFTTYTSVYVYIITTDIIETGTIFVSPVIYYNLLSPTDFKKLQ